MTNFAARVLRPQANDFPVRSLLDVDFYKPTMGAFIHANYSAAGGGPGVRVRFALINRDQRVPLARIVPEDDLRWALDHICSLRLRRTDLYYLRGMDIYGANMFRNDYLQFLAELRAPTYELHKSADGRQYELWVEADWAEVTFWETIAMAAIMELYYRSLMRRMTKLEVELLYGAAANKLYAKLKRIARHPGIRMADFGQRRRHSFLWQKYAIEMAKNVLGEQFTGTSNTYLAFAEDLVPIGTNAHELPMVVAALRMQEAMENGLDAQATAERVRDAQYVVLRQWAELYGPGLRIVLPDTYGSDQFFANMPADLAHEIAHHWRGQRQDSGDPVQECRKFIAWLKTMGIDHPKKAGKVNIFSDGLDVKIDGYGPVADQPDIIELYDTFKDDIITPFGWGTNFTNDFKGCLPNPGGLVPGLEDLNLCWRDVFKGFSLVCKVALVNGMPAVKLSNTIEKATGPRDWIERYLTIFGSAGRIAQPCSV